MTNERNDDNTNRNSTLHPDTENELRDLFNALASDPETAVLLANANRPDLDLNMHHKLGYTRFQVFGNRVVATHSDGTSDEVTLDSHHEAVMQAIKAMSMVGLFGDGHYHHSSEVFDTAGFHDGSEGSDES